MFAFFLLQEVGSQNFKFENCLTTSSSLQRAHFQFVTTTTSNKYHLHRHKRRMSSNKQPFGGNSANVNANNGSQHVQTLKSQRSCTVNVRYTVSPTTESETLVSSNDFKTSMSIRELCEDYDGWFDKDSRVYRLPWSQYIAIAEALKRLKYNVNFINKPLPKEERTESKKMELARLTKDVDMADAACEMAALRAKQIERACAEILKEADLSTINTKDLCSRAYNIELVDVFANTLDSSALKLAVKRGVRKFINKWIEECDDDEERRSLGEALTREWKYEKAVAYVLNNETNLETDGSKTVTKRVLKRLNEEEKYDEISKTVKGLIKSAIGRSEKIELEKEFLAWWKGEGKEDDEDAIKKKAEEALDKLTTFENALEEREEHAAEMLKVATERRKKRKAQSISKIEHAPAMYADDLAGGLGFGGGYVGGGKASMSIGMGGFR